jgi:hypothetical protein
MPLWTFDTWPDSLTMRFHFADEHKLTASATGR